MRQLIRGIFLVWALSQLAAPCHSFTHQRPGSLMGFANPVHPDVGAKRKRTCHGLSPIDCSFIVDTTSTTIALLPPILDHHPIDLLTNSINMQQTLDSSNLWTATASSNIPSWLNIDSDTAEAWAGPFFGGSLLPYLAFLYFLSVPENETPKGVTVGFTALLLFVFLTIPAAIAAKLLYGVSLADSDWLHGSAESLLTMTNLVTVVAFRQALQAKEQSTAPPQSAISYAPMTWLVVGLTTLVAATALVPALSDPQVHTLYLGGFLDLPLSSGSGSGTLLEAWGAHPEPANALSVPTWIIHVSSLVEFLVAMGFCWRWADIVGNPKWKGLTWGLLPLHSSGITACTYHLFYNHIPILVPLQALLTCAGNTTAAWAALRIALSNGWTPPEPVRPLLVTTGLVSDSETEKVLTSNPPLQEESDSLIGFEDLGDALAGDNDYSFLIKLFVGCAAASYAIKYGETFFDFPYDANVYLGFAVIGVPSALNAFKWYKRSQDPSFEGWF